MSTSGVDLLRFLTEVDGFPHLDANKADGWIAEQCPSKEPAELWNTVCRQWLDLLAHRLGPSYRGVESHNFFLVADLELGRRDDLIQHAESCRDCLLSTLGAAASFAAPGKQVILAFGDLKRMYQFSVALFPKGTHGAFSGLYHRGTLPLILVLDAPGVSSTLTHELLHAAVPHLDLPIWLEEGLAQSFEVDLGHGQPLLLTLEDARECREFWHNCGLDPFWDGSGFGLPGDIQKQSYRLAWILARLLLDDAKPGFFGFGRDRQRRFIRFVESAKRQDDGSAAYLQVYGHPLRELAQRFLGPTPPNNTDQQSRS